MPQIIPQIGYRATSIHNFFTHITKDMLGNGIILFEIKDWPRPCAPCRITSEHYSTTTALQHKFMVTAMSNLTGALKMPANNTTSIQAKSITTLSNLGGAK